MYGVYLFNNKNNYLAASNYEERTVEQYFNSSSSENIWRLVDGLKDFGSWLSRKYHLDFSKMGNQNGQNNT